MRSEWKKYALEDVCEKIYSGGTPSTKHPEYWNGNIKWLSSGETSQRFVYDTERKITQLGVDNSSTKKATKGCTVIATAGQGYTRGQASFLMTDTYMNQSVIACKANEKIIDPLFLYYNLDNRYEEFRLLSDGTSTRGGLSGWIVKRIEIQIPCIAEQCTIARILKSLDEKIEVNKKINKNLQEQAQVIYNDMFITNANPSWQSGQLSDLITVRYGKDHKKLADGTYPVYGSGGIMRYVERPLYDKESVLIPRKGTLNNVMYVNEPFWSVDTMFFTEMRLPDVAKFVFHFIKSRDLVALNAGSAVPSMTTDILNTMELLIPDADTLTKFENVVAPMYLTVQQNTQESSKLAELRDFLLPRLMSGEIDVSDIDL